MGRGYRCGFLKIKEGFDELMAMRDLFYFWGVGEREGGMEGKRGSKTAAKKVFWDSMKSWGG